MTGAVPPRAVRLRLGGHEAELRGHAVVADGKLYPVGPASLAVLRALAAQSGHVYSRPELLTALPASDAGEHAVEMPVTRLRAAVGDIELVETVVKRGYRLPADDRAGHDAAG